MGAWGTAIFSDDLAADVRDAFTDSIAEGMSVPEAVARLLTEYREDLADPMESNVFWLALAATQWKLGRLTDEVREHALQIIDSGQDLLRWQESSRSDQAKRKQHLEKLRAQLVAPQPTPKKLRPRLKSSTDFQPGDVASYRLDDQLSVQFCVVGLWSDRGGTYANICLLGLDDHSSFTRDNLTIEDTLGPHFTMLFHEPVDRITLLCRNVALPESTLERNRAWNSLPVPGWACQWDDFPEALRTVLSRTGWVRES